ncbi:MAG: site-specific integrase [Gammaproteobacteria bacterium]|nr:MAG: site-specific integrase [Gammaproteobacteria bacterium]
MKHQSPSKSKAHQILRLKCAEAGIPEEYLRDLLWWINADDALTCFVPICENLTNVTRLMNESFALYCAEHQIPVKQWANIANWVLAHGEDLAETIGEQFNQRPEKPEEEHSASGYSKVSLINPLVGRCATRNSLYTVLLNSLASKNVDERERYFLMVGQLIVAHVHVCRKYIPRQKYEDHAGSNEIAGYPNTPYGASHALRVISNEEDLDFCPSGLDPKLSPHLFAQVAGNQSSGRNDLSKHLAGYCRFVARAHGLLKWSNRKGGGGRRGRGGGGRWISGYVNLGPDCEVVPAEVGDPDDPHGDWGKQVVVQEVLENGVPITKKRARQLYAADIHPYDLAGEDELCLTEYPCDETKKGIAGLIFAAEGQARHIAMEHQMLPWQYRSLTVSELASLLSYSSDCFRELLQEQHWSDAQALQAETIALIHISLWTGSTLDRAKTLEVLPGDKEAAKKINCELALFVPTSTQSNESRIVEWRIRSYFPKYRVHLEAPAGVTRRRTVYMYVPDLAGGAQFVRELVSRKEYQNREELFSRSVSEYRRALRALLKTIDPSKRITVEKVRSYLFHRIACVSGDVTQAVAITGCEHELAQTRIYYTTHSLKVLRNVYVKALQEIVPFVYRALGREPRLDFAEAVEPATIHVGSRFCPTREAARETTAKLRNAIKKATSYRTREEFADYHNYFTLYTVLMFGYTTSCRAIISPFLPTSEIDPETGLAALADKDGPDHHKSRLIWIPHEVRKQIRNYEAHRQALLGSWREYLTKPLADIPDCFFLHKKDKGRFVPELVRPATLKQFMKAFIDLPANVHRRFLRTELGESGCPSEIVNAFIGHWSRGEEPFSWFSSFSYHEHIATLERYVPPLLKDLGWQPIESTLTKK